MSNLDFRDPEWVAEQLNLDKNAVYRYLNEGLLPGMQLGRKWLISESSLAEYLKAEERRQTQERRLTFEHPIHRLLTDRAVAVLREARGEALQRMHDFIGTEHLLSAIVRDGENVGAKLLAHLGIPTGPLLGTLEQLSPPGISEPGGPIGLTPRARKVIELAVEEAGRMNHTWVGCEHLVLGMLLEGEGLGAVALKSAGVSIEGAREALPSLVATATRNAGN